MWPNEKEEPLQSSKLVNGFWRGGNRVAWQVPEGNLDPELWVVDADLSLLETVPLKYLKADGDTVVEMTSLEKPDADTAELEAAKALKCSYIDLKTAQLITDGFEFVGKKFSLSLPSQAKMMGTHQVKDDPALVYPIKWNTKDEKASHNMANATDLDNFYKTGLGHIRQHLDDGTALKEQVRVATTVAGVWAVEDNR